MKVSLHKLGEVALALALGLLFGSAVFVLVKATLERGSTLRAAEDWLSPAVVPNKLCAADSGVSRIGGVVGGSVDADVAALGDLKRRFGSSVDAVAEKDKVLVRGPFSWGTLTAFFQRQKAGIDAGFISEWRRLARAAGSPCNESSNPKGLGHPRYSVLDSVSHGSISTAGAKHREILKVVVAVKLGPNAPLGGDSSLVRYVVVDPLEIPPGNDAVGALRKPLNGFSCACKGVLRIDIAQRRALLDDFRAGYDARKGVVPGRLCARCAVVTGGKAEDHGQSERLGLHGRRVPKC